MKILYRKTTEDSEKCSVEGNRKTSKLLREHRLKNNEVSSKIKTVENGIMLTELSQRKTYNVRIALICGKKNQQTNEYNKNEADSRH